MNWVDFPAGRDPEPVWALPDVLTGVAAAGWAGVGLDDYSVRAFLDAGGTSGGVSDLLERLSLRCTDVGILRVGVGDAVGLAVSLAELASATASSVCVTVLDAPVSERVLRELELCADVLDAAGARLALEFAPYGALTTLAETVSVCERVGWKRCGVLLDIWHFVRGGAPWEALRRLGPGQLALVHVSDAPEPAGDDLQSESRYRRLPPGTGTFPTADFVAALRTLGYEGVLSAEVLSAELRALPPQAGARTVGDALRSVLTNL